MEKPISPRRKFPTWPVIAGAGGTVTAVLTSQFLNADWWGSLGEWVGAAGTVAAVWTALHISSRDARTAEKRREIETRERAKREQEAVEEQATRQANLVLSEAQWVDKSGDWHLPPEDLPTCTVYIWNHSSEPVVLPRVEGFVHPDGGGAYWNVWIDPTTDQPDSAPVGQLKAHDSTSVVVDLVYDPSLTRQQHQQMKGAVATIGWSDTTGQRWRRVGNTPPQRVMPGDTTPIGGDDWYRVATH